MGEKQLLMALYENRKQFLTVNFRIHGDKCGVGQSYMYAISHDLYPFFSQEYSLEGDNQDPYSECYKISPDEIGEILKYIDDEWLEGRLHTFYDLEQHFGSRFDRWTLICVLRYCYLDGRFDDSLWEKLVEWAPSEAKSITRELNDWEI
ncbi:hypothetical protein [Gilvimarinus japonicus]|uniref:Uncharacterized protein n=1 Tax=Gilvimarinus japonicus TaxID=1796469 RepID=A0ABV7HPP0_9GAMM